MVEPTESWDRLQALFDEAVEHETAERAAFVAQACGDDAELKTRLGHLLAAYEQAGAALEGSTVSGAPWAKAVAQAEPRVPARIGRFTIKRTIASGGMGTVYEAVQEQPRRTVAVKVMKPGLVSRSTLRRFEFESQLLARLRHPGIAQVFEAGTHDDGSGPVPYFAMEYVPNAKPITAYAEQKKLTPRERLELFARVCDAVQHGHTKGIIHRDLKPGNILVDSRGQPRVIDFGVGRCTDSDMARATLQTDVGQLIGTLQYMSPEQCEADPHDLDTRSDVYALGVVLYELLCGKLPYDVTRMAVYEATRVVREQAPARLSTLDARLRGEVETIVTKALEKDRERRYRSAAELADDIRRYLTGDAITARPASMVYQLRVFARRNKPLVAGVAATFVALVIGVVVSTSLYYRSEIARASAVAARDEAKAVTTYLSDALASLDPDVAQGRDVTLLREVLDDVARRIETEPAFADDSLAQANLRMTIGVTYGYLGLYGEAEPHLNAALETRRRVLGEEDPETLKSADRLAYVLWRRGQFHEAESLYRQTLEIRRKVLGADHPEVAESLLGLAMLLRVTHDFAAAETLIREGLMITRKTYGQEHAKVATMLDVWADLRRYQRDLEGAEPLARQALAMRRRLLGDDHLDVAKSLNILAIVLDEKGDYAAAESFFGDVLEMRRRLLGREHPLVAQSLGNLSLTKTRIGKLDEAVALIRQEIEIKRARLGDAPWDLGVARKRLGSCLTSMGRYMEAERELIEAQRVLQSSFGQNDIRTIRSIRGLVRLYELWGKPDQAAQWRAKLPGDSLPQP